MSNLRRRVACCLAMHLIPPSECLVWLIVYKVNEYYRETDPDWDKSLEDDVKAECESKFGGRVENIVVERDSKVH